MIRALLIAVLPMTAAVAADPNMMLSPDKAPVVSGSGATRIPGCPDWTGGQRIDSAPETSRNFGCATNANLAAMLDDPADLLRGRSGDAGTDGRVSVKAIQTWREAKPTGAGGLKEMSVRDVAAGGR